MQEKLPGIIFCCLLLFPSVLGVVRLEDERSSFVSLKQDTCLQGHVIQAKKASSFINCAHYCLANGRCKSVNFIKKGICELNDVSPEDSDVHDDVKSRGEVTLGWWISYTTKTYVFTSLNGQRMNGPTSTDGYKKTSLQGTVTIIDGIQYWVTPESGNYVIEAVGASGANGTCSASNGCSGWSLGGKGAKMKGSFSLKKGIRLKILVGQQGACKTDTQDTPGGGGGGTFVSLYDDTPLIVAGGGGGGGITLSGRKLDGDPGQTSTNGSRYGGTDGNGGLMYDSATKALTKFGKGAAGAGFYKEGDSFFGTAAKSFIDGGTGGSGNLDGGFGGGGFAIAKSPGGGGGYSGGGVIIDGNTGGSAGGGGSFNSGTEQDNESGVNKGDGRVTIILSK